MKIFAVIPVLIMLCFTAGGARAEEHIVKVVTDYENMRMVFEPRTLVIAPGDTVTWVNEADEEHNILSYPDGFPKGAQPLDSPYLKQKGEKWSHTFTVKGTYEYQCVPHVFMGMHGSVVVERPSVSAEFHVPTPEEVKAYRNKLLGFFEEDDFQNAPHYARLEKSCNCPEVAKHHK